MTRDMGARVSNAKCEIRSVKTVPDPVGQDWTQMNADGADPAPVHQIENVELPRFGGRYEADAATGPCRCHPTPSLFAVIHHLTEFRMSQTSNL